MNREQKAIISELEGLISTVPEELLPEFMGEVERLRGLLLARLFKAQPQISREIPSSPENQEYLRVAQVSKLLGISKPSVYLLVRKGEIPSVRFGKQIRIPDADLKKQGISKDPGPGVGSKIPPGKP